MTATYWILSGLLALAALMCVWAWLTGGVRPDRIDHAPEHSRELRGQDTRRLRPPPAPDWIPYDERPGGEAPWLPRE